MAFKIEDEYRRNNLQKQVVCPSVWVVRCVNVFVGADLRVSPDIKEKEMD